MNATPEALAAYQQAIERDYRRNLTALVAWDFTWGLCLPFILFSASVPAYLGLLQSPKALIGFILSFPVLFAAGQILVSYVIPAARRQAIHRHLIVAGGIPWLLYSGLAYFWGHAWPAGLHFTAFTVVIACYIGVQGLVNALYWEMMVDNIPPRKRGRLYALRTLAIGAPAALSGAAASRVLAHWPAPRNYHVAFVIGLLIYLGGAAILWRLRDHVNPRHARESEAPGKPPFFRYLAAQLHLRWKDPNYRIFLFFMVLLYMAYNALPFMVDAARTRLGASSQQLGGFSVVWLAANLGVGWALGLLADRAGYRLVGAIIGGLLAAAFLLCLATRQLYFWYAAYGAYAVASTALPLLLCNMGAELCPHEAPNRLMAIGNMVMAGFVLASSTFNGWIADRAGSYGPVFIANLVLSAVVVLGFSFIVREPRSGRLYALVAPHP